MNLPDESQWDETTCHLAVCQHPQCWAAIRRIERGHPRILSSSCKPPLNVEERLPMLTVVNLTDSCFEAKRLAHRHLSKFAFTKARPLSSQGSKFDLKFQGSPAEKKHIVCSQNGKMERKKSAGKDRSSRVHTGTGVTVLPSSPGHLFEQLSLESVPFWNHCDMLPQDLLQDLLLDKGKTIPFPEMKTQLAVMKKKPPLEKSRPDSAISAKMYLSVHRLTLQKPALRYPEHLRKLYNNLTTEGGRKQQRPQQKRVKTPSRKQEATKKSRSAAGSHKTSPKHSGHRTLPRREGDKKQQQQTKTEGPAVKQDATKRPQMASSQKCLDSFPSKKSAELLKIECTSKDVRTQVEVLLETSKRTPNSASRIGWHPELKLLRILQATDEEDEENQPSGTQSEESLEA
ncbi:uncharacterized protein C9orf43 homolog isoform X1 [Phacochoerus africanus]|uniref:uncharacterized protein C9orf43 homolog isoform X1 n=1 Tax=Phacochoerus africanus TaxID=41426 RepID=UPI001FD88281|nr:uncharacterized protein C9orf43 homolog isoform X1 [Phacochoerus africanus]